MRSSCVPRTTPTSSTLTITYRNIRELRPDPKNPRAHSKKQIRQIARSIEAFGFNVPILVNRDLQVIAGHGRLAAGKLLGIDKVPTLCLEHLSEQQIRAFMIADNRLTENATWNDRLLGEQFKALSEVKLDFSLETTGFEMGEIDLLIEGTTAAGEDAAVENLPESLSAVRVSKPGDLWQLGRNRLVCGDALRSQTYDQLMQGKLAQAVFTDPPYNDPIDGFVTGKGKVRHAEFAMASGEMTNGEFMDFLARVFANLKMTSVPGSIHYICMDWRHVREVMDAAEGVYAELKNLCVWVKDSGGMGSFYRSQHELVFVFKNGREKHRNNVQLGQYGRCRTNVWQFPRVNFRFNSAQESNLNLHPTVKPVELVEEAILDCSARGDIVLDAFLGSGTTLIAAERAGRICFGIELDPIYVDLAVRRWETYTGGEAFHATTKRSFGAEEVLRDRRK